ncbi:MAG: glycosyltransferase family 39 protein [Lachnospiraceae bacterium]|nr:glycosyltransferase family 39 protein [Lachnospiraceae bacterium]
MVLVLLLAYMALFIYQWKKHEEDVFDAFAGSLLLFAVLVLVITNLLSLFYVCTRLGVFVSWLLVTFVTVTAYTARFGLVLPKCRCSLKALWRRHIQDRTLIEKLMLLLCLLLCVILFIGALFTVPQNYDSMTYHLARIAHWIDQRSVNHFVTNIDRQLYSPVLAEYYLLHLMLLTGSDSFVNLLQYCSMLVCAAFLYKSARLLHTDSRFSVLAVFLFLTMPLTISQSVTTQNDLFAASIFAMFLYYFLWFIKRDRLCYDREEIRRLLCIGILVGLAYITKTSVCASMLMFMPWLLVVRICRKDSLLSLLKAGATALLAMLAVISESLIRNSISSGKIMPETASSNIMVATKNVRYILVNILKNFALLTTQHLSDALNGFICRIAIHTGALLKVEVNNEAISFHGFDFITHMNRGDNMYSHDVTPSALVAYLSLVCGVILLGCIAVRIAAGIAGARRGSVTPSSQTEAVHADRPSDEHTGGSVSGQQVSGTAQKGGSSAALTIGFGISAWLSLGFIMALLRWQPWGTRLMYPALAMMVLMIANLLGFCLAHARKWVCHAALLLLIVLAVLLGYPSLTYNMEPAADNLADGCRNRLERYFAHNKRYDTYEELADCTKTLHPSEEPLIIGVNISGDGYDYPLWLMFKSRMPQATLQHLRFDAPQMVPDAPELLLWVEKEELNVGDTVRYGDVTYECVFVSGTEYKDAVLKKR